jgi:hypothetical protein
MSSEAGYSGMGLKRLDNITYGGNRNIKVSLAAMSSEAGYSGMGLKRLDNITYGGNRNIKVSGDGLAALRLSTLGYNLVSDLLR